MLHLRSDCLSPVLYQRSLPSLYLLHSPCRLCEVLPLYVCMSERFSFYSVYLFLWPTLNLHCLSVCSLPYDLQPVPDSDSLPPASTEACPWILNVRCQPTTPCLILRTPLPIINILSYLLPDFSVNKLCCIWICLCPLIYYKELPVYYY